MKGAQVKMISASGFVAEVVLAANTFLDSNNLIMSISRNNLIL